MRLLTAPFDPSAHVPSALVRPLLEVAIIAAGSIALLLAADTLAGEWRGLGRAAASGGSHAAMIAAGWVIALGGAPRWRMPAAASAAALIVASVAARLAPAGAVLYFLVPLVLARQAGSTRLDTRWIGCDRRRTSPLPRRSHFPHGARGGSGSGLLSDDPRAGELCPSCLEWKRAARLPGHPRVLRRVPSAPRMIAGPLVLVAAIALATAGVEDALAMPLRHLYVAPAAWAALRSGSSAAGLVGLMAGFWQA